jgi:integrase
MAFFTRQKSGRIKAYYARDGKNVCIPATEVRRIIPNPHELSDYEIKMALERWTEDNGVGRIRSLRLTNFSDSPVNKLLQEYFVVRRRTSNASEFTLQNERSVFVNYILDFFIRVKSEHDVRKWFDIAFDLTAYLDEHPGLKTHKSVNQVIYAFNRFGKFLGERRHIQRVWRLSTVKNKQGVARKDTPLPREHSPEEIMEFADKLKLTRPDLAVMTLVGYFASLRPSEAQALIWPNDFLTGAAARSLSKTYERLQNHSYKGIKLGNAFAVKVTKSVKDLPKERQVGETKTPNSNGVVTIWYPPAVKLLAELLAELPAGPIVEPMHKRTYFDLIRKNITSQIGLSGHDLRRSSGVFLARTIGLDPFLLQDHLRHADLATTLKYTRRPKDTIEREVGDGSLDDIFG